MRIHRVTEFSPSSLSLPEKSKINFLHICQHRTFIHRRTCVTKRLQHLQEVKLQALLNQGKVMKEYIYEDELTKVKILKNGQTCYIKVVGHPGALQKKHEGPFKVIRRFKNHNYLLKDLINLKKTYQKAN